MKPALYPEVTGHFCHTSTHSSLIKAQVFQPKGQFMPDLVCHDLTIWILHNITNRCCLGPQIDLIKRDSIQQDLTGTFSIRCQHSLQLIQQRAFS